MQDPAKAVLRVYRDTRFSNNKTPYKTYVAAALRRTGLSKDGSGVFYFHLDESGLFIAGGVYAPMPDELRAIREYLAEHYEAFFKMTSAAKFKSLAGELHGGTLDARAEGLRCVNIRRRTCCAKSSALFSIYSWGRRW